MLLIWGFKIRSKVLGVHDFFCPACGGDRKGELKSARRWFTFFWIPLIPLKEVGEFVTCQTCKSDFNPSVLEAPTTSGLNVVLDNAVHALTLMMVRAADPQTPALRAHAVRDLRAVASGYDEATLQREVGQIDPGLAEQYVGPLADNLAVSGKERLMADLIRVGLAGDGLSSEQRHLIDRAGRGLGLTPAHITGIVSNVAAADSPPITPHRDDSAPTN